MVLKSYFSHYKQTGTTRKQELTLLDFINQFCENLLQMVDHHLQTKWVARNIHQHRATLQQSGPPAPRMR